MEREEVAPHLNHASHETGEGGLAFAAWLQLAAQAAGALSAGCLRVDGRATPALAARYEGWLACGNRGRLAYLDRSVGSRSLPFLHLPQARSIVVIAFAPEPFSAPPKPLLPPPAAGMPAGRIASYAGGEDYHRIGQRQLATLAGRLEARFGPATFMDAAVDTKPVPEVFLAAEAGLGLIGRNGLLRTPQRGSRLFLGSLWTSLELPEVRGTPAAVSACRHCGACARACPTGALAADGFLHLDLCRSYWSMEYRGPLDRGQAARLGDALFGCDACTASCPPATPEPWGIPVDLEWLVRASAGEIRHAIAGTAAEHAGVTLLRRNAAAVLANRAEPRAAALLQTLAATNRSPVVQQTLRNLAR